MASPPPLEHPDAGFDPEAPSGAAADPYARGAGDVREPPEGIRPTLRYLGPGIILAGSVVGSGEIIMTTSLGAVAGFALLWWILLSCWGKSVVQAELARYTVSSGEPALQALDRLPGKLPGAGRRVSWFIWLWLLQLIPGQLGGGGIYGGTGQAVHAAFPALSSVEWTVILAALAAVLVLTGTYRFLEGLLLVMVVSFTFITLLGAALLQFTPHAVTWQDLRTGLSFGFPTVAVGLALAAYGGTGVTAGESLAYTYWCVEKGYARFTGPRAAGDAWLRRARGWIRVMQTDVLVTLGLLTLATIPFYLLGAGVLHRLGRRPDGLETITELSHIYTETLGPWSWWLFMLGAFFILYSTVISGLAAGARAFADCMGVLGVINPRDFRARLRVLRAWAVFSPSVAAVCYYFFKNPVWMLIIGGTVAALLTPIVAGGTLYLRYRCLDRRVAPTWKADAALWLCFAVMLVLAAYAVRQQFVG